MKSIILKTPEVIALARDGVVVVRRPVKPQPPFGCHYVINGAQSHALCFSGDPGKIDASTLWVPPTGKSIDHRLPSPFGSLGEERWVRETWRPVNSFAGQGWGIYYEADGGFLRDDRAMALDRGGRVTALRSAAQLPQWASRYTTLTSSQTVERVASGWEWVGTLTLKEGKP